MQRRAIMNPVLDRGPLMSGTPLAGGAEASIVFLPSSAPSISEGLDLAPTCDPARRSRTENGGIDAASFVTSDHSWS
jgi:hypothetical protein